VQELVCLEGGPASSNCGIEVECDRGEVFGFYLEFVLVCQPGFWFEEVCIGVEGSGEEEEVLGGWGESGLADSTLAHEDSLLA